ncbi:MAG: MFS transporter [Dethiobacteria bacterium]|jgi:sugar phosphate permease
MGHNKTHLLAWIMWGTLALAYLIGYFHRLSLAIVLDYLIVDFKIKDAAVAGALVAIYALIYMVMQIPTGFLADTWGARKTVTAGMLIACGGSFIFAQAPSVFFAFLGRGLVALGVSVVFVCTLKFQLNWFKPDQFATITGLSGFVGNLGVALGTTPLSLLVIRSGWRNSFLLIGAFTFIVALACLFLVRDSPEDLPGKRKKPLKEDAASFHHLWGALKKILGNYRNYFLIAGTFGIYGISIAFTGTWSILYLMQIYEFSRSTAANYILVATMGMCIGFPLIGFVSDRLRLRRQPLLFLFLLQIAVWCLLLLWNRGQPPESALYFLFFLMGLSSSSAALIITVAKEINDPSFSGIALSVANGGSFLGMSVMQPLLGFILDFRWEGLISGGTRLYPLAAYRGLFATCLIFLIISFIFISFIKETHCQNIYQAPQKNFAGKAREHI